MNRWMRAGQYALGFVLFLAVWWGGSLIVGSAVLPPPSEIAAYIASPGIIASFFHQVLLTSGRGLLGFSLAWMAALPLGFLMGRREAGDRIAFFPVFLLQSAPPLFWVTPLVLWLGTKGGVPPAVAFLVSLPLLTVHIAGAVKAIPEHEYDVFSIYAPRGRVIVRELYMPHLLPALKSNIHLGLLAAIKAAMLAEWFASRDGFGRTIRLHYQFFSMTEFLSWALLFLVVIGGLSLVIKWSLERFLPAYRSTPVPKGNGSGKAAAAAGTGSAARTEAAAAAATTGSPARTGSLVGIESAAGMESRVRAAASPEPNVLIAENLTFGYRRTPLFENLSLRVEAGRPLVISGESGCGKTTLLKCLAGLLKSWDGEVRAGDSVGLVFQDDALLSHRDALGNVLLPVLPGYTGKDLDKARWALDRWGLAPHASLFPHELSGGMRKRLAMAREWFRDSSVLLLDEPFVNLDREARMSLWKTLFQRLEERGIPAVIVTHYPEEIADFPVDIVSWGELTSGVFPPGGK